jgi:chemotaxis protein CheD
VSSTVPDGLASNRYHDRNFGRDAVKILPGEFYVTREPLVLVTVLGSCVAACLRDPLTGIGGMNHFMLPEAADAGNPASSSARYGAFAMELLINQLVKLGARRHALQAKVFGGGNVLPGLQQSNVGERNAAFVLGYLSLESIQVLARDLLDDCPRKIYFFPDTGRVLVKKLRSIHNATVADRERSYRARLVRAPIAGDVELFG